MIPSDFTLRVQTLKKMIQLLSGLRYTSPADGARVDTTLHELDSLMVVLRREYQTK